MKKIGYRQSNADHMLYVKHKNLGVTALIAYVDDVIVTGEYIEEAKCLSRSLSKEFEFKSHGKLRYF